MEECADEKYDQRCSRSTVAQVNDWYVNVTDAPSMHWHVPRTPERVNIVSIPPIAIEVPISKVQQFAHQIQERMERQVEQAQPCQVIWYLKWKRLVRIEWNCVLEFC